ncbi:MAG: ATP-binding protein [Planctomycetia bacterium]|nr:ATP-binding protein [Planctomycetia bacterium]
MGLMQSIQRGRVPMPPRIMVYGTEGIGKSTLASRAPNPIFLQTEDGLHEIDCHKFPLPQSIDEVFAALTDLAGEPHEYQTIVVDTLDWLERLIWDDLCKQFGVTSIEKVDGGYGKGYIHALTYWRKLIYRLSLLHVERRMAVILTAHAKVEKFDDPESSPYDRYSPRLHKHACALITEWCDAVLFATRKMRTQTEEAGFSRKRTTAIAIGKDGGERLLRTVGSPACIAKNRYDLDAELPLDWSTLLTGITTPRPVVAAGETNS